MPNTLQVKKVPLVAVLYDIGSASLMTIRSAASRQFELVFICDRNIPYVASMIDQARKLARVLDVTDLTWDERVSAVRALNPSGVVTFSEYQLADTAKMAHDLALPGHAQSVVDVLTDKFVQREVLSKAGVQTTICALVEHDYHLAAEKVGFPAVLKPRVGAGSLNTIRVESVEHLEQCLREFPQDVTFILEEMLEGAPDVAGEFYGDYVSVESIHFETGSQQVCVTGKFPLAHPFRETGMFLPSTLPQYEINAILALEATAINAVGVKHGVTHTEIKLTSNGPKIIEINGRLGGYVPEILKRSSGINLVHSSLELAIGRFPQLPPIQYRGVCYQYFLTPPAGTRGTFMHAEGWSNLEGIDGVIQIEKRAQPGDLIDCQLGTQSLLGVVYGEAPDHDGLHAIVDKLNAEFTPFFSELERSI